MTLEQGALSGKYDTEHPFPDGGARAKVFNLNPLLPKIEVIRAELKRVRQIYWQNTYEGCL